jgi:hypothetical protein
MRTGYIETTNSNIRPNGAGPAVVWLTTNPEPKQKWTEVPDTHPLLSKWIIRITVNVAKSFVYHWPKWSREMGIGEKWYRKLDEERESKEWYVAPSPISKSSFDSVEMWSGFFIKGKKGEYSPEMLVVFSEKVASGDAPEWLHKVLDAEVQDFRGVRPVSVKEWMDAGETSGAKRADTNFEKDMKEFRQEYEGFVLENIEDGKTQ